MDYRDNRQRWAESHQVVHFYALNTAFVKLGDRVSQVEKKPLRLNSASRWLDLSPEQRAATGSDRTDADTLR